MRPNHHLQARTPARGARRAFTLVELLIVVSIIALLIALLLPALGGVRQSARRAATETLMREILTASQSFQAKNNRLPGYFSPIDLASAANVDGANARGVTMMESMLLDLAGGVVDGDNPPTPSASNSYISVGPFTQADRNVIVNPLAMGGADGPSYLGLKAEDLRPVAGQATPADDTDWYRNDEVFKGMPDIVDAWGQPVLAFIRDPAAPMRPPAGPSSALPRSDVQYFADIKFESNQPRSAFYWGHNAGYLRSGGTSVPTHARRGLGDETINQHDLSILGGGDDNSGDRRRIGMLGALGSPAYPAPRVQESDPFLPAQPRGSIILISAGPDKVFFKRPSAGSASSDQTADYVGYAPTGGTATVGGAVVRTPPQFDDIIHSGG